MQTSLLFLLLLPAHAQQATREVVIEVADTTLYVSDTPDLARYATEQGSTVREVSRNFNYSVFMGDVVAIDGEPAGGVYVMRVAGLTTTPTAQPGQAIADIARTGFIENLAIEVVDRNGAGIGTVMGRGQLGGTPHAGNAAGASMDVTIEGGTGRFLGASGQAAYVSARPARAASVREDPSRRRAIGGGAGRFHIRISVPSR